MINARRASAYGSLNITADLLRKKYFKGNLERLKLIRLETYWRRDVEVGKKA